MAVVAALHVAPVKGLRLVAVDALDIGPTGPAGDRAFHVREADGTIALTPRNPRLVQVVPAWDRERGELALVFPDGTRVSGPVERGRPVTTAFWDRRPVAGHVVEGPFAAALSEQAGRPVQLVARAGHETGGDVQPVSLMSTASLDALAAALDRGVDGRRFRMTITIEGVEAWEEHGWTGRDEGVTKLLFEPGTRRLLGAAMVGPNAGELIAETVHALEMGADAEDIGLTIHPHPTLSESVGMAAEVGTGTITDLPPKRKRARR